MQFQKLVFPALILALLGACERSTSPDSSLPTKGVSIVVDSSAYHLQRRGSLGFEVNIVVTVVNDSDHDVFISQYCGYYSLKRADGSRIWLGAYGCADVGGAGIPTPIRVEAGARYAKVFNMYGAIQPQARPQITLEDNVGEVKFTYAFTNESGTASMLLESAPFTVLPPDPNASMQLDLRNQFVFTGTLEQQRRIYVMSVGGGEAIRITPDSLTADCPVVSHDGQRILFVAKGDVWVLKADGSEMRKVFSHPPNAGFYRCPSWSPDDKKFVWTTMTPVVKAASPGAVYVVDVATGAAITLTTGYNFSSTDWSPDGEHILVGSNNYTDGGPYDFIVSVLRLDGTKVSQVASSLWGAAWAPDGGSFAYLCGESSPYSLCIADTTGSNIRVVTDSVSSRPYWSPDGDRIAFLAGSGVYIMNSDGRAKRILSEVPAMDISWSPDSRKLAWACKGPDGPTDYDICRMGADGSGFLRLPMAVSAEQITWPPLM
jgi:Tol biopolymer transport system component